MKTLWLAMLCTALFFTSCANGPAARRGTVIGAVGGGVAGGLIGRNLGDDVSEEDAARLEIGANNCAANSGRAAGASRAIVGLAPEVSND